MRRSVWLLQQDSEFPALGVSGGETDIEKEDWAEKVIPWAEKTVMNMDQAMPEVESVMPDNIKKGFWKDIYYEVWQIWKWDQVRCTLVARYR